MRSSYNTPCSKYYHCIELLLAQ